MTAEPTAQRPRRWRAALLTVLGAGALLLGVAVVGPAHAAPYINCNRPVYSGNVQATVRCDAASTGQVRLWVQCWVGPVLTASKYTAWVTIPGGTSKTILYTAHGWCTSFGQTWVVVPRIAGA
jgi:hypothetical protein